MTEKQEIEFLRSQVDFLSRNYVTGLYGRHKFMQRVRESFKSEDKFWIVMYDVDGLHEVNRRRGYAAGDSLLREVANDLKMCQKPCCVFHIGGDEFFTIYSDEPSDFGCENTTSAMVKSSDYESIDEMLEMVDQRVSLEKKRIKRRRAEDI